MLTALPLLAVLSAQSSSPTLEFVGAFATAAPGAEIVSLQSTSARAALTHKQDGKVELLSLSDPPHPQSLRLFDLGLAQGEELTSVAFHPRADWVLAAVQANGRAAAGRALALSASDGKVLASFPCGVGPDSVVIAGDGRRALIANEAEEFDDQGSTLVSAPGSLTLIEFDEDVTRSRVVQVAFEHPAGLATDGRTLEREIDGVAEEVPLADAPAFYEPEAAAFLPDGLRVLVTLQENNAVAVLSLDPPRIERLVSLGHTRHPADLVSDGKFAESGTLLGRREPDGIAVTPDGRFFVTADEGDTDPSVEKTPPGKPASGGRTLSVFDLAGSLQGDTGPELDRQAARAGLYPDNRSPKKGSEPEMVIVFERDGRVLAATTLERAGALALVDLTDPQRPAVLAVQPAGKSPSRDEPEGLAHFRDPASRADYLYVANEGTGTLGVLRVPR
jgi:hypothetical protein